MSIDHLLNRTLNHQRGVTVDDGAGGSIRTWADLAPLACRTSQPSASERLYADRAEADLTQFIYAAAGADVRVGDVLVDGTATWRVTALIRPSVAQYLRADCELIQTRGDP
ncbi:head-tail adaptor protein [Glycomyces paridis]|uniref:phage head completion protein n=1 Tax=Glycomyces paridis TaxID=2126555 RepID=UPI0010A8A9FA|nr:head-tail adaptor protein [Glycomyces paridis]